MEENNMDLQGGIDEFVEGSEFKMVKMKQPGQKLQDMLE